MEKVLKGLGLVLLVCLGVRMAAVLVADAILPMATLLVAVALGSWLLRYPNRRR